MNSYEKQSTADRARASGTEAADAREDGTPRGRVMTDFVETSWVRYDLLRLERDCVRLGTGR